MVKYLILSALLIIFCFIPLASSQDSTFQLLKEGKKALDSNNFERAIDCFNKIIDELKEIGDYILLWRAKAYYATGEYEKGLKDINELLKNHPYSPITREAKKIEIEFFKKLQSDKLELIYDDFLRHFPDEIDVKLDYAQYLKKRGKTERAKNLFKEIFITVTPFADMAERELLPSDITVSDLLKKAQNLNNAYLFKKAEKYLLKALNDASDEQKKKIYKLLGYSLFMQKRYTEAVDTFIRAEDIYWLSRSYLRAKDYDSFERLIPKLIKFEDEEIGRVLIHYANILRRSDDTKKALDILNKVFSKYPILKEEALWNIGWILYKKGQFDEAKKIFEQLYSTYRKTKYLYWSLRAEEKKGSYRVKNYSTTFIPADYYSYLFYLRGHVSSIPEAISKSNRSYDLPLRVEILLKAQLRDEALMELKWIINNNRNVEILPFYIQVLYSLGDYPTSVRLISKITERFTHHELLYPQPYLKEVQEASKRFEIDPYLIFAIMREESRFDRRAISVAGACGLMQLMYQTAFREGKKIGISITSQEDLFDPQKNIIIGVAYLKKLINEFKSIPIALAAYNAGENVVQSWLKDEYDIDEFIEDIPFSETKAYVQRVLTSYGEYLRGNRQLFQNFKKVIKYKKEDTDD